jgi:hypothetical protein
MGVRFHMDLYVEDKWMLIAICLFDHDVRSPGWSPLVALALAIERVGLKQASSRARSIKLVSIIRCKPGP